jgi:hypothetical protein
MKRPTKRPTGNLARGVSNCNCYIKSNEKFESERFTRSDFLRYSTTLRDLTHY